MKKRNKSEEDDGCSVFVSQSSFNVFKLIKMDLWKNKTCQTAAINSMKSFCDLKVSQQNVTVSMHMNIRSLVLSLLGCTTRSKARSEKRREERKSLRKKGNKS
jgi:hypothetical protein